MSSIDKPELETLDYEPKMSREEAEKTAREYFKTSEQPDKNALIFEQIKGCSKMIVDLLGRLRPKTKSVNGCIYKLEAWQDDYLRILQKAFK